MYLAVCPPRGPGSIPGRGGVFQGIVPWLITLVLSQHGREWFNLPSIAPHNMRTSKRKTGVQPWIDNS